MHCALKFVIFIQLIVLQNAFSREITAVYDTNQIKQKYVLFNDLKLVNDNTQRSMTDLWNHIKNSAKTTWDSLKTLVEKTKENIGTWIQHIKNRATTIRETLKEKFTILRTKIRSIVDNVWENEKVQSCVKKNAEDVDHILIEILNNVFLCISEKVSSISALEEYDVKDMQNDTEFMEEIEKKLNKCSQSGGNVEECLLNVRIDIIKETELIKDEVLKKTLESRNLADDILDAITTCFTDGLIKATAAISTEAVNILQCLVQHGVPASNVTNVQSIMFLG